MGVYNNYISNWIVPLNRLVVTFDIPQPDGSIIARTVDFTHASTDSNWSFQGITVPDYNNGGVRTVAHACDIVFAPPYNDFGALRDDFEAVAMGIVKTVSLTLKAPTAQPKGATMLVSDNYIYYPLDDWSISMRT